MRSLCCLLSILALAACVAAAASAQDAGQQEAFDPLQDLAFELVVSELSHSEATVPLARSPDEGIVSMLRFGIRAIFDRTRLWPVDRGLKACFYTIPPPSQTGELHRHDDKEARGLVVEAAALWQSAIALRLDFGAAPVFRTCQANDGAELRIAFWHERHRAWSQIGSAAAGSDGTDKPTFVLRKALTGVYPPAGSATDAIYRHAVVALAAHELGHALGLLHEHQSGASDCMQHLQLSEEQKRELARAAWPHLAGASSAQLDALIESQILDLHEGDGFACTPLDASSVMGYSLPARYFADGHGDRCAITPSLRPSATDLAFAALAYPPTRAEQEAFIEEQRACLRQTLIASFTR